MAPSAPKRIATPANEPEPQGRVAGDGGQKRRVVQAHGARVRPLALRCAAAVRLHFSVLPSRLTSRRARRDRARSFHALDEKEDDLDDEFSIDDDDASTVKPRPEQEAEAQPASGGVGVALSKPPSSSATAESPGALSQAS